MPSQRTHETVAYLGLYFGKPFRAEGPGFVKMHFLVGLGLEYSVDNDAVEVHMRIE